MKKIILAMLIIGAMASTYVFKFAEAQQSQEPPVAGGAVLGVTVDEIAVLAKGWSAKKQIIGHEVYNDQNQKVGKVYDIIIAPDKAVSYGIVAAGGFLGVGKHDVAIPANQFKMQKGKIVLPGATKDVIKEMPEFHYAK